MATALLPSVLLALVGLLPPQDPAPEPDPVETLEYAGIRPLSRVGPFLLAGQPSLDAFLELAENGLVRVIDLRRTFEQRGFDEGSLLEEVGVTYSSLPFGGAAELEDAIFDEVRRQFAAHREAGEGDLLLHCAGSVRVGAVWLPVRVLDEGVELEVALEEAHRVGLSSKDLERTAVDYVRGGGSQALGRIAREIEEKLPKVPRMRVDQLERRLAAETPPLLLDARASEEYAVSHLAGAANTPSVDEALAALEGVPRDREIVTYCSVGWRSGYLARDLREKGFTRVTNLEGSIFAWANSGRPLFRNGEKVQEVHPYDAKWGELLHAELRAALGK